MKYLDRLDQVLQLNQYMDLVAMKGCDRITAAVKHLLGLPETDQARSGEWHVEFLLNRLTTTTQQFISLKCLGSTISHRLNEDKTLILATKFLGLLCKWASLEKHNVDCVCGP